MKRVNKTKSNLQVAWQHLDDACGSLENAIHQLGSMVNLPEDIKEDTERIDIGRYVYLKNRIEELIQEKDENE